MLLNTHVPTDRPDLLPDALHVQGHELLPPGFSLLVPVAVDEYTQATLAVAGELAKRRGAVPTLLYVMEIVPYAMTDGNFAVAAIANSLSEPGTLQRDEEQLRASCGANTGAPATWPFEIEMGQSASSIVSQAHRLKAKCVLMGLHHHNRLGRALGADTLREVMALGGVPVMAVLPGMVTLPKSVAVAMDFSRASVRAARMAREIMDERGTMHLIFVDATATDTTSESDEGQRLIQSNGVTAAFEQVIAALDPAPGMTINVVRREGAPAPELIAACQSIQPDLVALGSQRHPFLERLRMGSVARAVVTTGRWSVLVTPPGSARAETAQ